MRNGMYQTARKILIAFALLAALTAQALGLELIPGGEAVGLEVETQGILIASVSDRCAAESIKKNRDAYPVVLCEIGKDKIAVVKVIREWTGLSLKDAVNYVNQTPITLRATSKDNAAQILHDLQEAGATVEMR